jgi:hypothetical protein
MLGFDALGRLALGEGGAANATALEASAGVFALTFGSAVGAVSMPAETGSFTIAGQSALSTLSMPAETGSFLISGQAATLSSGFTLYCSPNAVSLRQQFGFSALGELALGQGESSSNDTTFRFGFQNAEARFSMAAGPGSYVIAGQAANLFSGYSINPQAGAYLLTGSDAPFLISMPAARGVFTLTANDVEFRRAIGKIRAFPRVGHATFSAKSTGRDTIKIRAFGG